jgi:DNA-directed RNA polymerase subunit N (RpoN/RPB10)
MIDPVRCFTCNRVIGGKFEKYRELLGAQERSDTILTGVPEADIIQRSKKHMAVFEAIGVGDRYCCKRMLMTHVELIN